MAVYTITGGTQAGTDGPVLDITGVIRMDDSWEGSLGAAGWWTYRAQIQSFDLKYGGFNITGNKGDFAVSSGADDMWFTLENESGQVLDMWASPFDPNLPDELSELPAPDFWSVSPRDSGDSPILVGPLNRNMSYITTHIKATLRPDSTDSGMCRILRSILPPWLVPERCRI